MDPRPALAARLARFTTDPAVRVGILQATWSVAPAFARGLLPRTPVQQAGVIGVTATSYYAIGALGWSGVSSVYAGVPGHRAGPRALLTGAAITATTGYAAQRILEPRSGDSVVLGAQWSAARFLSTIGTAGGLVTLSDVLLHRMLNRDPGVATLALDVAGGCLMAAGTLLRRNRRISATRSESDEDASEHHVIAHGDSPKVWLQLAGVSAGTTVGIAALALAEQAVARTIQGGATKLAGTDLGEAGALLAHTVTAGTVAAAGGWALQAMRRRTERRGDVKEPAYPEPPTSEHVSAGPASAVDFEDIGKEGRRFVLMTLPSALIEDVMEEPAADPVRVVVPRDGTIADRADLAVAELERLGAFERSLIVVASPTGVGYVNYVMAEALEYLTRGDCATVVPQYALVPSALALDRTAEGTELQAEVMQRIVDRSRCLPRQQQPRIVQFGESLGAQVALDVAAAGGVHRLDVMDVEAGLYLGVPFRSRAWQTWWRDPRSIDPDERMVRVDNPSVAADRSGMHLMVIHDDDPVNKFAYSMFVRRPWWLGKPEDRPPKVPKEVLFRPIISFVIAAADLLNGMNMRPGEFRRVGHDYRYDMRVALQKAFSLRASPEQEVRIESALREREQVWAQTRLFAKAAARAMGNVRGTLRRWGQEASDLEVLQREDLQLPASLRRVIRSMTESAGASQPSGGAAGDAADEAAGGNDGSD